MIDRMSGYSPSGLPVAKVNMTQGFAVGSRLQLLLPVRFALGSIILASGQDVGKDDHPPEAST